MLDSNDCMADDCSAGYYCRKRETANVDLHLLSQADTMPADVL